MKLEIISPEKTLFSGLVELVTLPGMAGRFTILSNHAPIISSLAAGVMVYRENGKDNELAIDGGFIEMKNNVVTVCVD
jgi:ATP synthase, F1 epsilon subunit (delta in mitochondria)